LEKVLPKLNDEEGLNYKYYFVEKVKGKSAILIPFNDVNTL
jgi:hypothetical protein